MLDTKPLILASRSPRRKEALDLLSVPHIQWAPAYDETLQHKRTESIETFLKNLIFEKRSQFIAAWPKAHAQRLSEDQLICCADTIIVLDGRIIGKPESPDHSKAILQSLSNRSHTVFTCVGIGTQSQFEFALTQTQVHIKALSTTEIDAYIKSEDGSDKAGAYGLQGLGGALVSHIEGSVSGVVGMPLAETLELLQRWDIPHRLSE